MSSLLNNITKKINSVRYGKVDYLPLIKHFSKGNLDNTYANLNGKIKPGIIKTINNETKYLKANSFLDTLKYPFVDLPRDFLTFIARKFNIKSLQNSNFLQNYAKAQQNENYKRALRGLLKNGDSYIAQCAKEKGTSIKELEKLLSKDKNDPKLNDVFEDVAKKFFVLFDDNLAKDKAHYHTPRERAVVRIVSGFTAAFMLGNDFYNKSIMNDVSEDEAIKSANTKKKQEILATIQEALSQYFLLGAFANFSNNSQLGAPILNTVLGIVFNITSRLSTKRPLKRIDVPEKSQNSAQHTIDKYINDIKQGKKVTLNSNNNQEKKQNKKHILSAKNIIFAVLASIGIGFALRGLKSTKLFNNLKNSILNIDFVKNLIKKYHDFTVGEVWINKQEAEEFYNTFSSIKKTNAYNYYKDLFKKAFNENDAQTQKIFLGEYEKMSKIPFTNIQMSRKELLQIPLMPIKFVTELLSYPYKAVSKILEGLKIIKKTESKVQLKNDYRILNTYIDFKEQLAKFNGKSDKKFIDFYREHYEKNMVSALNKETQSSVKNAAIGKTTQLMGTFSSLYFATTDEFNNTASQTGDKQKAQKDARLRGVNKIIRIATQVVIMNINNILKIPYAQSILGAGIITGLCTALTDSISRTLSGMPYRKMNKEELEKYQKLSIL